MVSTCGSTISQNCSYIKNPGFPSALSDLSQCKYTIAKCDSCKLTTLSLSCIKNFRGNKIWNIRLFFVFSNIVVNTFLAVCDFRLDFESFDIAPPSVTDETTDGHGCQDVMQAMVNTGSATSVETVNTVQTFNALPEICGNNQGQHRKIIQKL